jgi:hypothetical protein
MIGSRQLAAAVGLCQRTRTVAAAPLLLLLLPVAVAINMLLRQIAMQMQIAKSHSTPPCSACVQIPKTVRQKPSNKSKAIKTRTAREG